MKTCSCCCVEKPFTDFYKKKRGAHGVGSECKTCCNKKAAARAKERRATDPDFRAKSYEHHKKYVASEKGHLAKLEGQRRYLASERGRAITRASNRNYKREDAGLDARRYAAMKQATPGWYATTQLQLVYAAAFERKNAGEDAVVDHIVPLISKLVCGLHVPWNLQVLDRFNNRSKGNRHG